VIPTLILFGLIFGHWWRATLIAAAVGWPILVIVAGIDIEPALLPVAALAGVANAAVGVLVHRGLWLVVRSSTNAARLNG
jgi:hypothetical protein